MTVAEKVRHYTDDSAGPDACWPWTGPMFVTGYGQVSVQGRPEYGHRLAYQVHRGTIPAGRVVRHRCDNPRCVNPAHLVLGSKADNSRDMVNRGRSCRGPKAHSVVLTEAQVREIRTRYRPRVVTQTTLANEYGVSRANISAIVCGRSWGWLRDA